VALLLHFRLTATGIYLLARQKGAGQAGEHIERINGTLRSRLRSLVRRTRDVARTAKRLEMELFWSGVVYNFCTVHTTLAGTPTMAAGITTKVWSIRRLLTMRTLEIGTLNSITSFCSAAYDITGFSLHYQLYTCSHSRGSGSVIICPENPLAPPLEARLETSVRIGDIFELIVLSADREEDSLDLTL
jgi:hypothetical protein